MSDSSTINSRLPKYSLAIVGGMINDRPSIALDEKFQRPCCGSRGEEKSGQSPEPGRVRTGLIHEPSHHLRSYEPAGRADGVDEREPARERHAGQEPHGNRKED